jgi:hypothetical protein
MPARTAQQRQLASAIAAARTFLGEAEAVYQRRPHALSAPMRSALLVDQFIRQYRPTIATEEQEVFLALALNAKHAVTKVIEVARRIGEMSCMPRRPPEYHHLPGLRLIRSNL